jgi:hypothetical protein
LKCRGSFATASASDLSDLKRNGRFFLVPITTGASKQDATFSHHNNIYGVKSVLLPRLSVSDIQKTGLRTSCNTVSETNQQVNELDETFVYTAHV